MFQTRGIVNHEKGWSFEVKVEEPKTQWWNRRNSVRLWGFPSGRLNSTPMCEVNKASTKTRSVSFNRRNLFSDRFRKYSIMPFGMFPEVYFCVKIRQDGERENETEFWTISFDKMNFKVGGYMGHNFSFWFKLLKKNIHKQTNCALWNYTTCKPKNPKFLWLVLQRGEAITLIPNTQTQI